MFSICFETWANCQKTVVLTVISRSSRSVTTKTSNRLLFSNNLETIFFPIALYCVLCRSILNRSYCSYPILFYYICDDILFFEFLSLGQYSSNSKKFYFGFLHSVGFLVLSRLFTEISSKINFDIFQSFNNRLIKSYL